MSKTISNHKIYMTPKVRTKLEEYQNKSSKIYLRLLKFLKILYESPFDEILTSFSSHRIEPLRVSSRNFEASFLQNEKMYSVRISHDTRLLISYSSKDKTLTVYDILEYAP